MHARTAFTAPLALALALAAGLGAGAAACGDDTATPDAPTDGAADAGDSSLPDDAVADDAVPDVPDAGDAGEIPAEDAGETGDVPDAGSPVPSLHPADPHRLFRNGATWYPAGYYPGAALNMTGPDWAGDFRGYNHALLDRLAEHGIELFRVWINWGAVTNTSVPEAEQWDHDILTPYVRTGPGEAADGRPQLDLDQLDPEYFAVLEDALAYAEARGIVVQVLLLDCWHAGFGRSHGFDLLDFFQVGNNVNGVSFASEEEWFDVGGPIYARNVAFVEQVVERLGGHANVIWETCNEKRLGDFSTPAATAADPFHAGLAAAIHARETAAGHPRHLVVPVDLPEHRTVAGHRTPTNGGGGEESIEAMHDRLAGEQFAWNVPLITDNDCCAGEPDAAFVRRKAWAALAAGAHIDVFNNELYRRGVLENANTADGMRWVGHLARFVREAGVDLVGMVPSDALVDAGWAFARAGDELLVVLDGQPQVTVSALPAAFDAAWFDPRTGSLASASGGPTFVAPGAGDWVLHVRGR
jgi:hypothetical protein